MLSQGQRRVNLIFLTLPSSAPPDPWNAIFNMLQVLSWVCRRVQKFPCLTVSRGIMPSKLAYRYWPLTVWMHPAIRNSLPPRTTPCIFQHLWLLDISLSFWAQVFAPLFFTPFILASSLWALKPQQTCLVLLGQFFKYLKIAIMALSSPPHLFWFSLNIPIFFNSFS